MGRTEGKEQHFITSLFCLVNYDDYYDTTLSRNSMMSYVEILTTLNTHYKIICLKIGQFPTS